MTRSRRDTDSPAADATDLEAAVAEPPQGSTTWFLATIGLSLLCFYLAIVNIQGWLQLEAVCEVAMSKDALTLCLQYGAR
jgi:hypothetical protein